MKIIKKEIELCVKCNNYKGIVIEEYNGEVVVYCKCTLVEDRIKYGSLRSPCMICPSGDNLYWTPTSHHKEADGKVWSTPYFHPVEPFN